MRGRRGRYKSRAWDRPLPGFFTLRSTNWSVAWDNSRVLFVRGLGCALGGFDLRQASGHFAVLHLRPNEDGLWQGAGQNRSVVATGPSGICIRSGQWSLLMSQNWHSAQLGTFKAGSRAASRWMRPCSEFTKAGLTSSGWIFCSRSPYTTRPLMDVPCRSGLAICRRYI